MVTSSQRLSSQGVGFRQVTLTLGDVQLVRALGMHVLFVALEKTHTGA